VVTTTTTPASYRSPIRANLASSLTRQRGTRPTAYDEQQGRLRRSQSFAVEGARADYAGHGDGGLGYDGPAVIVVTNLVTITTPPFVVVVTTLLRRFPSSASIKEVPKWTLTLQHSFAQRRGASALMDSMARAMSRSRSRTTIFNLSLILLPVSRSGGHAAPCARRRALPLPAVARTADARQGEGGPRPSRRAGRACAPRLREVEGAPGQPGAAGSPPV
jgi:hypothetical protein